MNVSRLLELLNLEPLPGEGGFYRETYRSASTWISDGKPRRPLSTAIYFLLTPGTPSRIHRLPFDEVYHFYLGDPVELLLLGPGESEIMLLGNDLFEGMQPQICVPANTWQGSRVREGGTFALLGTTMAPGFHFQDLVLGERDDLLQKYPDRSELIQALTCEGKKP
ncbi:MAG TPA: cupin domain-containing protein [Thermoanaerobaculia bacterium]|nr:cupin domain-containing protein [Thermoanaerobaculia bacterium]HUM30329.1 cupin domain-containing protein [Thermoanaerobaculia bacterium]HXK68520.1 cupin domain-containing protein [Thermoanaerobaculia bacterium]